MITRRAFCAAPAVVSRGQGTKRPNLLFLMADDHAGYVLGADGDRQAATPNLDRLAGEGLRFSRHYCNSPVCTPSRQSLLTGQMPHSAGVTQLRTALSEEKPTLAKQLRAAGYQTAAFGKMHFNQPGRPGLHGFDVCMTEDQMMKRWREAVKGGPLPEGVATQQLPWQPFRTPAAQWLNAEKRPYPRVDSEMRGTFIAGQACEYLEANAGKPFALWVSLHEPHSPFDFPVEDRGRFAAERFTAPRVGPEDGWQIPLIFRGLSDEQKRGIMAAYYTSAHFLDRNLGRVLGKLAELGLEEETLVVYTADHGYCLGHHGRFEKHCGYEPALRVPLLVRWPGRVKAGVVADFTEHVDVGPAVLEMLGAPALPVMHGQALTPYLRGGRVEKPRDHVFLEYQENEEVYIRDARWKFIYGSGKRRRMDGYETDNPTPGRYMRLFDLRADPGEFRDVSAREGRVVERMMARALGRFRGSHPDAGGEPGGLGAAEALDYYLRPRDNAPAAEAPARV
ncbi:MAG: sulfatase-like hydrolase/transferase [Bryobacteraceae bacterium]|nr:sulfatase-like hydrolase/transferase [Bryobacteraceae bacterium]